ncbi:MAG TPA: prepilin-type N-terminal cleavage/methylation domain-containing protein [Thermoanaerobaculia bacterium]|nr:prepilin-type N-terminal cleavage/methylation domain-containing protein [Thermoanaerobaculia bacterium]
MRTEAERDRSSGFSVVEVMIASAIFLLIAIGVLPLFTQSIKNNLSGREATEVSNHGRSKIEELLQMPFASPDMTVPTSGNVGETKEYWSDVEKKWKPGDDPDPSEKPLWLRTIRIRQYAISDLTDNNVLDNPLSGSAANGQVHLKEIEVEVESLREAGPLGGGKTLKVRMLRAI